MVARIPPRVFPRLKDLLQFDLNPARSDSFVRFLQQRALLYVIPSSMGR